MGSKVLDWAHTRPTRRPTRTPPSRALLIRPEPLTALFTGKNRITVSAVRRFAGWGCSSHGSPWSASTTSNSRTRDAGDHRRRPGPPDVGRAATQLLFRRLDGDHGPGRRLELPARLIPRGSGEIPPSS